MSYTIIMPVVEAVTLPAYANQNTQFSLKVKVTEKQVILEPEKRPCGTFYCGEE